MSHDLPFGADTLVIPFTFVRPPSAAPRWTGMSRMRPRSTYRLVPPDRTTPGGSIAPIRVPRSPWDPPLSYARQSEGAAALRLVSDEHHEDPAEREERELLQEVPEPVPHAHPPPEPRADFTEPPQAIHIPIFGGGSRASGRTAPPIRPATLAPGPVGGDGEAAQQPRTTLRQNLERAGQLEPGDPRHSHHLVPQGGAMNGDRNPELGQQKLREWGIDINSALNGAPLSRAFHARIHTSTYYEYVRDMTLRATSREEMLSLLERLRAALVDADKAFQQTGEVPNWLTGVTK